MSHVVHVELGERSYDIRIDMQPEVAALRQGARGQRVLLVSDSQVDPLYGAAWQSLLEGYGLKVHRLVIPAGESSKSLAQTGVLYEAAVAAGLDRQGVMVALGGGVVGDLVGFTAATYLRGVRFVQAPTTLLAMVDSAVGGKTGINLPAGKNLVGAFYQPIEVAVDLATLRTLPEREYRSGLAEVVKYGVIWDAALFRELEASAPALSAREPELLERVVARCCEIKAEVVAVDERDAGVRAILNFGHTLGHAIEQASGYGHWLHGEAVAMGMVFAAELSRREKALSDEECRRVKALLGTLGLPVHPGPEGFSGGWPALRAAMNTDKKSRDQRPRFVLAEKLGSVVFDHAVADAVLDDTFAAVFPAV